MKSRNIIYYFAIIFVVFFNSCNKEEENITNSVIVATISPSQVDFTTAISGGNITSDGGSPITMRGVCYSLASNPSINDNKTSDGSGSGIFVSAIKGLNPNTTYYVRAYATNSLGTAYGVEYSFTTSKYNNGEEEDITNSIIVATTFPSQVASTTAISGGNIASDGGSQITARGVCYNTASEPSINDNRTSDGLGSGIFVSEIKGLSPNTTYYVRAYAINSLGTAYGAEFSFTTLNLNSEFYSLLQEPIQSGTNANLFNVTSFDNTFFIAGDGLILKSSDLGRTWKTIYTNQNILFYGVEFSDNNTGYAIGLSKNDLQLNANLKVCKTIDGGNSWILMPEPKDPLLGYLRGVQKEYSGSKYRLGGISMISNNRLMCGAGSSVYFSSTGGRGLQWGSQPSETTCVYYLDEDRAFKGGKDLSSGQAGGTTFGSIHEGVIFDIDFVNGNIGFAIEECDAYGFARVFRIDANQPYGGIPILSNWEKTPKIYTQQFSFLGLDFINASEGMIVGENGMAYFTIDGGNVFEKVDIGTSEQLNKVHFINNGIAVIVGNNGKIIRIDLNRNGSVEDGRHHFTENNYWIKTAPNKYNQKNFYKACIQNSKAYVLGDGVVLTSKDGGNSWNELISDQNKQFRQIEFVDNNIGWLGAISDTEQADATFSLYKTTDGGNSWKLNKEFKGQFIDGQFIRSHIIIKDKQNIKVISISENFFSNDGGATWKNEASYGVYFSDVTRVEENKWLGATVTTGQAYSFDFSMQSFGLLSGISTVAAPPTAIKKFGSNSICMNNQKQVFMTMDKVYKLESDNVYHTYGRFISDNYPFNYFKTTNMYSYIPLDAYGVFSPDYNIVYMVGEKGFIAKSTTGGDWPSIDGYPMPHKTWYGEESGVYTTLWDIAMFDQDNGIAVGDQGVILVRKLN